MQRRIIIPALLVLLAGCQTLQIKGPIAATSGDWLTTGGSTAHNAAVSDDIAPPLVEAWTYNALAAFGPGSPIVLGDYVLISNLQGEVHAINLEDGKRVGYTSFRESIASQPVVLDGQLIVANAWGKKTLRSYNLERASKLWQREGGRIIADILPAEDAVLVADVDGFVRLVSRADGADIWNFEDPDGATVRAAPLEAAGYFVVAHEDGTVRAFEKDTGRAVWETELDAPVYTSPTAAGGMIYLPTTRGKLIALDASTGRVAWQFDVRQADIRIAQPSVRNNVIYFGASDGFVRAISTDFGAPKWRALMGSAVNAQVLVAGAYVYVGTMGNRLVALDFETGGEVWSTELEGRIKSSMAPAGDGILVMTEPRYVTYFRPEAVHATN